MRFTFRIKGPGLYRASIRSQAHKHNHKKTCWIFTKYIFSYTTDSQEGMLDIKSKLPQYRFVSFFSFWLLYLAEQAPLAVTRELLCPKRHMSAMPSPTASTPPVRQPPRRRVVPWWPKSYKPCRQRPSFPRLLLPPGQAATTSSPLARQAVAPPPGSPLMTTVVQAPADSAPPFPASSSPPVIPPWPWHTV
jgi:hypothetical protein